MLLISAPQEFDWQKVADQATVSGVLVALMVGIATTVVMIRQEKTTRIGQEEQTKLARAAASRAERAAGLTEDYTRRVVEALEVIAAGQRAATAPRVTWSLQHLERDAYQLTNLGNEVAINVRVTAHRSMVMGTPSAETLAPDEALTFLAVPTLETSDSTISVRWFSRDSGGEEQMWKYPLPPSS
ncbi:MULTISPECIES: hypothetical protein [unclassified Micromonospora]|uniref:hypothetical protein n=1 Tax=unclassified Micromonospora TaxID=2617518 RepID=UPI00118294AE|nr:MULTISPECIES: hypothetical protein [unclassified Micromonospora]MDI5937161.1 hypothetical protein [Micromonospora sp. DH15]